MEYKILAMNYLLIRRYNYVQLVMRSFVQYRILVQTVCCVCCLTLAQMKHSALPPGANPSLGRKQRVTSVTSSTRDTYGRHNSSRGLCDPPHLGQMHVISVESSYDHIIGMDLMQTLGHVIHNSSKAIAWGQFQLPFKPHNYFFLFQAAFSKPDGRHIQ
jgi:hypothetical protein